MVKQPALSVITAAQIHQIHELGPDLGSVWLSNPGEGAEQTVWRKSPDGLFIRHYQEPIDEPRHLDQFAAMYLNGIGQVNKYYGLDVACRQTRLDRLRMRCRPSSEFQQRSLEIVRGLVEVVFKNLD